MDQYEDSESSDAKISEADLAQWFENPWWPLGLALGWLVWRDSRKAVRSLMLFTRDPKSVDGEENIEGQQISFDVARIRLENAAHAGEVKTIGKPITGELRIPVNHEEWDTLHLEVKGPFTLLFHLDFDYKTDELLSSVQFTDIAFDRADVIARWPLTKDRLAPALPEPGRNKGGHPQKYDTAGFLIEAFRLLYERRVPPTTAAEHRRLALNAFSAKCNQQPSDEWAKLHIRRLRFELDLKKP